MLRITSPSHPLIYAFLLQEESLNTVKNIIVETENDAVKLQTHLVHLAAKTSTGGSKKPIIVKTHNDLLRAQHYDDVCGISIIDSALNPPENQKREFEPLIVKKGGAGSEKKLIDWLTNNGYSSTTAHEEYTYYRQGDTVLITTTQGHLQVNFFGNTIEHIYLDHNPIDSYTLIGV